MAAFPTVKLADCVIFVAGFAFKSQHFTDKPDDIPLVKGENVSQGCILWEISKRWSAADWPNLREVSAALRRRRCGTWIGRGFLPV